MDDESRIEMKLKTLARCLNKDRPVSVFCDLDFGAPDIVLQTVRVKKELAIILSNSQLLVNILKT